MLAVYRAQMIKYFKSVSTWLITLFGVIIVVLISALMPNMAINKDKPNAYIEYIGIAHILLPVIISSLVTFITIFSGFKAATMYKDEVENGNFLVLLSKPINRSKIILMKWLALFTLIVIHVFVISFSYVISVYSTDVGRHFIDEIKVISEKTLTDTVWQDFILMFGILILISLLFSSITLLITTKFSMSSSIAATIGLGVWIPISSVFGTFTQIDAYSKVNSNYFSTIKSVLKASEKLDENVKNLYKPLLDEVNKFNLVRKDNKNLFNVAFSTGSNNSFHYTKFFDFDFQTKVLSNNDPLSDRVGDSRLGKIAEKFLAKPYYFSPIKNDPLNNAKTLSEKNKALNDKLIYTLEQIDSMRNVAFDIFYKNVLGLFKTDKKLKSSDIKFNKASLLQIKSLVSQYLELNKSLSPQERAMYEPLVKTLNDSIDKKEQLLKLSIFDVVANGFALYRQSNKNDKMTDYLSKVDKNQTLNFTGVIAIILNSILSSEIYEDREKQGLVQLFNIYYRLESPIQGILFDSFYVDKLMTDYKVSVNIRNNYSRIGRFTLTESDQNMLNRIVALHNKDGHAIIKVEKKLYMSRQWNSIIYSLATIILVVVSIYVITRQNFQ